MSIIVRIGSMGRGRDGADLFFGQFTDKNGVVKSVLCHSGYRREPVIDITDPDLRNWEVVPSKTWTPPAGMILGRYVRVICEEGPNGLRATAWCLASEYQCCLLELAAKRREAEDAETERQKAKEAEANALLLARRRAEAEAEAQNPSTYQSAIEHGWRDTSSGNPDSARRVKMVKMIDDVEHSTIIDRPARRTYRQKPRLFHVAM